MPFKSLILAGSPRLEQAAAGGPAVKPAPPPDNPDAVRRIQKALVALGFPLPLSFPNGPNQDPDGKYGQETFTAVIAFQRKAFPTDPSQWDGRVGKNTLAKMDAMLPAGAAPPVVPPATMSALAEKDKATSIQWAQAAVRSLTAARLTLQSLSGGSTIPGLPPILPPAFRLTFDALEAHFHISTAAVPQIAFIDAVIAIYQKVLTLLANSRAFFVDDTASAEAAKGTPAHVPFGSGKVNFTPSFKERDNRTSTGFGPMCRAAMVLHEPVHVVDHPAASMAVNHVHENDATYAAQPAANQLHNAHSYASFGQHVFFGRDTRFGAGKPAL